MQKIRAIAVSLLIVVLTGCGSNVSTRTAEGVAIGATSGAAVGTVISGGTTAGALVGGVAGGVIGGMIGHRFERKSSVVQRITNSGVQIVQRGDNLTLILPSDSFFVDGTPTLNRNYYSVLNDIAELLRGLDKINIKVTGYTDNVGWPLRNTAISRQQAEAIAHYLWRQDIDTRLITATGYGEQMPIASNGTSAGQAANRRIEIALRTIVEPDDL